MTDIVPSDAERKAALIPADDLRLRAWCEPVDSINAEEAKVFYDLKWLMREQMGLGIAAPQIGVTKRMCIILANSSQVVKMANPVIISASPTVMEVSEGCLTWPGKFLKTRRHYTVRVEYLCGDRKSIQRQTFHGIHAVCAQHEIDHLNGVLFHMRAADLEGFK